MTNMKTLIRIVFVFFIANRIDCLGGVCDNCCDCLKEKKEEEKKGENNDEKKDEENKDEKKIMEYEEIEEDEINTAISLVNDDWYKAKEKNKENKPILKIFKKEDNIFTSTENGDKISIKLDENKNPKIIYLEKKEDEDPLKLGGEKYALFEIKTQEEGNTVYLYCSDIESSAYNDGVFYWTNHVSISVIACDTKKVTDMNNMFSGCNRLKNLNISNFDTTNVKNMKNMFFECTKLEKLDLKNFNITNVTDMGNMFGNCQNLITL